MREALDRASRANSYSSAVTRNGERTDPTTGENSGAVQHAAVLAFGTTVSICAAYGYLALGVRSFGADSFAPIAVVFALWPTAAAGFGLPLEQWLAREISHNPLDESAARAMLRSAAPVIAAVCVLGAAVAWAAGNQLFGTRDLLYPAVLAVVSLGAASMGVLRGLLAGRGRYAASSSATAAENVTRLLAGAIVVVADLGVEAYAAALMVGPLVILGWASALRQRGGQAVTLGPPPSLRPLAELSGATLLAQVVLGSPPVALAVISGPSAAVTAVFSGLALVRAPYLVAVGASVRALVPLSARFARGGREDDCWRLLALVLGTLVFAAMTAGLAPFILPDVVTTLFGDSAILNDAPAAGIVAGVVLAHGTLALSVALVAASQPTAMFHAWGAAVLTGFMVLLTPLDAELRVSLAFVVAELVATCWMAAALASILRGHDRSSSARC